jgi:hypothetical protein
MNHEKSGMKIDHKHTKCCMKCFVCEHLSHKQGDRRHLKENGRPKLFPQLLII